ncbi:hypothetical protein PRZ48_008749 [Zasmidium cellare]|uniref:Uncharacterized protein n=1 Tax=Zasmidium cellare TaxID=395010 RepID=A0ABR0EH01_ZASCE|nr:hypothetical protein PRZ48_008749 [Zasmidium cellare]
MFLVWAHYKVLLNPDPILCEGERLITGLPHDFVYDTIRDFYLMCLYLFARTFDIRALENDIMTQLILQHFLDDTVVDAGCVSAVDRWMDRTKNHFVEFATAQMAHLSWNNRRLRPEDDYDRTEFYILIKLFKKDEDYVKARLKGEVPYIPAENVCDFHRHRAGEQEECREKQRHLGLPVPPEDEEEDSEDE